MKVPKTPETAQGVALRGAKNQDFLFRACPGPCKTRRIPPGASGTTHLHVQILNRTPAPRPRPRRYLAEYEVEEQLYQ